jgi:hypothetical protein
MWRRRPRQVRGARRFFCPERTVTVLELATRYGFQNTLLRVQPEPGDTLLGGNFDLLRQDTARGFGFIKIAGDGAGFFTGVLLGD